MASGRIVVLRTCKGTRFAKYGASLMTRHGLWFLWAALGTAACGNVVSPAASPEDASVADRQTGDDHATPNADGASPEHDARQALDGGGARASTVTPDDVGTVAPDGGT